jgi:hypothetical protein
MTGKIYRIWCVALLFCPLFSLFGVEITVPVLEMASRGAMEEGEFRFTSLINADIHFGGGPKAGILLGLSLGSADLGRAFAARNFKFVPMDPGDFVTAAEYNALGGQVEGQFNDQAMLFFRIVKATAPRIFRLPLELSYFIGVSDYLCFGDEFASRFGEVPVESEFTGFYYFPDGIGGNPLRRYKGIHGVQGTGFSLALTQWERVVPVLYLYQDFPWNRDQGFLSPLSSYSGDLRVLVNTENIKLEGFMGFTAGKNSAGSLRGGLMAFFHSPAGADLLVQAGTPGWTPGEKADVDRLYFFMEPRLYLGPLALYVTFFYHPLEYIHVKTGEERGKADINIKVLGGNLKTARVEGGAEVTVGIKMDQRNDTALKMGPLVSFISGGVQWDIKFRANLLSWDKPEEMFEIFAGVRTAY